MAAGDCERWTGRAAGTLARCSGRDLATFDFPASLLCVVHGVWKLVRFAGAIWVLLQCLELSGSERGHSLAREVLRLVRNWMELLRFVGKCLEVKAVLGTAIRICARQAPVSIGQV